ncbi:MAG: biotin carboxylase [Actinomycetes bacterium]
MSEPTPTTPQASGVKRAARKTAKKTPAADVSPNATETTGTPGAGKKTAAKAGAAKKAPSPRKGTVKKTTPATTAAKKTPATKRTRVEEAATPRRRTPPKKAAAVLETSGIPAPGGPTQTDEPSLMSEPTLSSGLATGVTEPLLAESLLTTEPAPPSEPPATEPVPSEPAPPEPVPSAPVPSEPVPSEPVPSEPVPSEPVPSEPVPSEPVPSEAPLLARPAPSTQRLSDISQVRHFFRTNQVPIFFVGPSPFNLLGLDRWVQRFSYVTYYDPWDGVHPRVFAPLDKPYVEFRSPEQINNWLLAHPEVQAHIARSAGPDVRPTILLVCFDEQTERICRDLGYDLLLPSATLRGEVQAAFPDAGLGDRLPSEVPALVGSVHARDSLLSTAPTESPEPEDVGGELGGLSSEGLGAAPEGGATQYLPLAVEGVVTRNGTVFGPLLSELIGRPELTPDPNGWCGNETSADLLTDDLRKQARRLVRRVGDWLDGQGYRGYFELDLVVDGAEGRVYLGTLNPRISGATPMTNVSPGAFADVPLFLFHLLEFLDVDVDLDLDDLSQRWQRLAPADEWSQMLVKETAPAVERITAAPATGLYVLQPDGPVSFRYAGTDWHQLEDESELFFLRIYGPGDYRWSGADLGVIVTRGRLLVPSDDGTEVLSPRARQLIAAVRGQYAGTSVAPVGPGVHEV